MAEQSRPAGTGQHPGRATAARAWRGLKIEPQPGYRTPSLPTPVIERATSWPATERDRAQVLAALDAMNADVIGKEQARRRFGVVLPLDLAGCAGQNWQQRWQASGANDSPRDWQWLVPGHQETAYRVCQLTDASGRLILLDVIRPSYRWLFQSYAGTLFERFEKVRDPDGFAALDVVCTQMTPHFTPTDRRQAYVQLSRMLMHNGGRLADITLEDCIESSRAQIEHAKKNHTHWYPLIRQAGILSAQTPPTIIAASRRGQLSVAEIVDNYEIACEPIRDPPVDYLSERAPALDYTSLVALASKSIQAVLARSGAARAGHRLAAPLGCGRPPLEAAPGHGATRQLPPRCATRGSLGDPDGGARLLRRPGALGVGRTRALGRLGGAVPGHLPRYHRDDEAAAAQRGPHASTHP